MLFALASLDEGMKPHWLHGENDPNFWVPHSEHMAIVIFVPSCSYVSTFLSKRILLCSATAKLLKETSSCAQPPDQAKIA